MFRAFCCKVWRRSDLIFWGKIAPVLEPFKIDSTLVLLLRGAAKSKSFKIAGNTTSEAKGQNVPKIKQITSVTQTDCVGYLWSHFIIPGWRALNKSIASRNLEECSFSFPIKLHTPLKVSDLNGFPMLITSFTPKYFHSEQQLIWFSWFSWFSWLRERGVQKFGKLSGRTGTILLTAAWMVFFYIS